jgi:hypothetical protein
VIAEACEHLGKYITTEDLEAYFHAKKVSVPVSRGLVETYASVQSIRANIANLQKKIIASLENKTEKCSVEKYFELEFSMAHHFLIDRFEEQKEIITQSLNNLKEKTLLKLPN